MSEPIKVCIDFAEPDGVPTVAPDGTKTYGTPPVMLNPAKLFPDCNKVHEFEKCPKCGSDIYVGYGLAFGGFGVYKACENEKCDWWWKQLDRDDE